MNLRSFIIGISIFLALGAFGHEEASPLGLHESSSYSSPLTGVLQMFLALGAVILLAYLVLQKGLGSILKKQRSGELIKIKERLALDGKNALLLVEIDNKTFLLATSEKGVRLLSTTAKED